MSDDFKEFVKGHSRTEKAQKRQVEKEKFDKKIILYLSIGFVASCFIPFLFFIWTPVLLGCLVYSCTEWMGWRFYVGLVFSILFIAYQSISRHTSLSASRNRRLLLTYSLYLFDRMEVVLFLSQHWKASIHSGNTACFICRASPKCIWILLLLLVNWKYDVLGHQLTERIIYQ